jgi:hypothetical protein
VLLTLGASVASAREETAYFPIRLGAGSVGPLRLGMSRIAAAHFLHSPRFKATTTNLRCAQYVMEDAGRSGLVGACFHRRRGLIGFSVSGPVFCFSRGFCVNGRDVVPRRLRRGFVRKLNQRNGVYYATKREPLGGRAYQIVFESPGTDPTWSVRAMGFGPCKASSTVRYYVPVTC